MSKKSIPFYWVKPLATNLALYLSTMPSGRSFFLKIHLQSTCLHLGGRSMRIQVLFSIMDLNSLSMTYLQKEDYCLLEGARIIFHKIGKKIFTEKCKSPSSFAPSRFRINCRRTRKGDIKGRRSERRITKYSRFE